jgi:hypothetical protein
MRHTSYHGLRHAALSAAPASVVRDGRCSLSLRHEPWPAGAVIPRLVPDPLVTCPDRRPASATPAAAPGQRVLASGGGMIRVGIEWPRVGLQEAVVLMGHRA